MNHQSYKARQEEIFEKYESIVALANEHGREGKISHAEFRDAQLNAIEEATAALDALMLEVVGEDEVDELIKAIENGGGRVSQDGFDAHKRNQFRQSIRQIIGGGEK